MHEFFRLKKPRLWRCLWLSLIMAFIIPYLTAVLPCGGAKEQLWLDKVIARIEHLRDTCEDPEEKAILAYTARRYRKIGPFSVQIRHCTEWCAGLNMPYCPGVTIDPTVVDAGINFGVYILTHEAQHDCFPYFGHSHFVDINVCRGVSQ